MEELWNQGTEPPPDGMAFFLMDVKSQGKMTPKMTPQPPCPGCGYIDVERAYGWGRWDDAVWPGDDIFHFPTSRSMVVTKRIVALFEDLKVSNVEVRALKPGDPVSLDFYTKLHDYERRR